MAMKSGATKEQFVQEATHLITCYRVIEPEAYESELEWIEDPKNIVAGDA